MKSVPFENLKGKTISKIQNLEKGRGYDELIEFECTDGSKFGMKYDPDCCASCSIEDIIGDVSDLLNTEILLAEEVSSTEPTSEVQAHRAAEKAKAEAADEYYYDSHESETWTFYKLATIKGSVTIRWYGESNGYYSESASFYNLNEKEDWQ
jgi:hypothetical protein